MPWFYVDDGFSDSKPVSNLPDTQRLAAIGLWTLAGSWSAKEETDGHVPSARLRALGSKPALVKVLTDPGPLNAALWERTPHGILFKSWDKWQPTHAELEAERLENERKREADAARKRAERAAKNGEELPPTPRRRRKGRNAVTIENHPHPHGADRVKSDGNPGGHPNQQQSDVQADLAGARLDPTRPDPTRSSSLVTSGGGGTSRNTQARNGSDAPPPQDIGDSRKTAHEPPAACRKHPGGWNHDENCAACGRLRKHAEGQRDAEAESERQRTRERAEWERGIHRCPIPCPDSGMIFRPGPHPDDPRRDSLYVRCPHDRRALDQLLHEHQLTVGGQ